METDRENVDVVPKKKVRRFRTEMEPPVIFPFYFMILLGFSPDPAVVFQQTLLSLISAGSLKEELRLLSLSCVLQIRKLHRHVVLSI
jgi:hypothetical protein